MKTHIQEKEKKTNPDLNKIGVTVSSHVSPAMVGIKKMIKLGQGNMAYFFSYCGKFL